MSKEMYSYHTFMFPFRFDYLIEKMDNKHDFYKKYTFDERVKKDKLNQKFKANLEKDNWCYKRFKVKDSLDYNQISYFYDFVEDTLYNTQDFKPNATSYYFEKNIKDDAKYIVKVKQENYNFEKEYILDLTKISLKVFDTGIAILNYEVENQKYPEINDILKINEFGRRIYPQFLGDNFDLVVTKNSFLADYIEVCGIKDEFKYTFKDIDSMPIPKFITKILGDTFTTDKKDKDKFFIQPVLDDRMFVVSWYGNDCFSNKLKNIEIYDFVEYVKNKDEDIKEDKISWYDKWYEYIFLDGNGKMVQNRYMQQELIKKSTYFRWKDYGTLYGVTRYSFVCLTDREYFGRAIVANHMKTIYLQMSMLLLAQRASIVRFSDEITALSDIEPDKNLSDKIANLYKNYLRFKNKLYFKEITPQEQGIELYDNAREVMRIDDDIQDLSNEIGSLNNYAFVLDEKEEREEMNKLTKLGTIFLPGTFLAGIFGMNVFKEGWIDNLAGIILAFGSIFCLTWWISRKNNINLIEFIKTGSLDKEKFNQKLDQNKA